MKCDFAGKQNQSSVFYNTFIPSICFGAVWLFCQRFSETTMLCGFCCGRNLFRLSNGVKAESSPAAKLPKHIKRKLCNSQGDGVESPWWRLMKAVFSRGLFPHGKRLQQQQRFEFFWWTFICARQPLSTKHSGCNPHWLPFNLYLFHDFLVATLLTDARCLFSSLFHQPRTSAQHWCAVH